MIHLNRLCSEKNTPTRILLYIFLENVYISTKFPGNIKEELSILPVMSY